MKSKIIIVTVVIALNLLFSGTAAAKTITVDDSGGCDYTSIQDAINSNIHGNIGDDDYYIDADVTIIVYPGVYKESLKLLVPLNLKAYSLNPDDTVIESDGYALDLSDVIPTGDSLEFSISGFTIRGSEAGIYEEGDGAGGGPLLFLTIEDNVIAGGNYGAYLYGDFLTISNNTFKNNSCGLYVERCDPSGSIIGNDFTDNSLGLRTNDCFVNVKNNTFTKNELAIASAAFEGPKITSNIIRDNKAGISIGMTSGTLIASNIIEGNLDYGIECASNYGAKIYNNYFNNEINIEFMDGYGYGYDNSFSVESCEGPNIVGGPYIGGNFWRKPDGTGFSQTHQDTDMDGFCDEPYVLNDYATDYLPLKKLPRQTITVDDSGGRDYTSIQDAINDNIDVSGITIIVYPGVYKESLKLLVPLTLKANSSNPADTVIESDGYAIDLSDAGRFAEVGSEFSISGFTIRGAEAGISAGGGPLLFLTIEDNVIAGGNYGAYLYEDFLTIRNNTFKNNTCGLYVERCDPSGGIIGNEFTDNSLGLRTNDCFVNVKNNTFTKNELAIASAAFEGPKITSNIIRDNKAGISIGMTSGTLIASNIIEGNLDYGIDCDLASGAKIYDNYFNNSINAKGITGSEISFSVEASEGPNIVGGPSIGGNFWGKPDGTGFSQTHVDTDMDGFCDESYVLDDYAIDYLPLKEKVTPKPVLPVANFTINVTDGSAPLCVKFTSLSENATGISWDFENDGLADIISDGLEIGTEIDPNIIDDNPENPVYVYTAPGNYIVNLTVWNENGKDSKLATINVSAQPLTVFPGYTNPPSDLDQDGLYEDVNGNEILDFDDVVAYYDNMEWIEGNVPLEFYDYNNNGLIDFDDVVKLYDML
jgi:parallel beta-helix repeat protein